MPKILVHEKALAHLSRGLYRSPASALRELVSNSWDANATKVEINTNYPLFYQLSIEDNGDGFTADDFESIMGGGIGNSTKRSKEIRMIHDRPIIGRLGIGMLGIAQICGAFSIISKPRSGNGFRARVTLYDLLKERLDSDDETIITAEEVDVGEYDWENYDPSDYDYGTRIIADDVHPTFVRTFQKSLKFSNFRPPSPDLNKNMKIISGVRSLQELGDYWRLLWELSTSCPIPYLNNEALPDKLIMKENKQLENYNFKVVVDNIPLRKPILLRGNRGGYTTFKIEPQEKNIYNNILRFHGYLILQEGSQLRPDELRGILIRIKNVSIGYYDQTMLDYRYNEGPRSRWLTGEIFVDNGLENALNIDRDSFNRFHPEYKALQEYIHDMLHTEIFPVSYKKIEKRSVEKKNIEIRSRENHLREVITNAVKLPVNISHDLAQESDAQQSTTRPIDLKYSTEKQVIDISTDDDKVEVRLHKPDTLKIKKSQRQLATSILTIFELALKEKDRDKQREIFKNLLIELLEGW